MAKRDRSRSPRRYCPALAPDPDPGPALCPALGPPYVGDPEAGQLHPPEVEFGDDAANDGHPCATASSTSPDILRPGIGFYKDGDGHIWELFENNWWISVRASDGHFEWEQFQGRASEPTSSAPPSQLGEGFWKDSNCCIWQWLGGRWWHHQRTSTGECEWIHWPLKRQ